VKLYEKYIDTNINIRKRECISLNNSIDSDGWIGNTRCVRAVCDFVNYIFDDDVIVGVELDFFLAGHSMRNELISN